MAPQPNIVELHRMPVVQLRGLAVEQGVSLPPHAKKEQILSALYRARGERADRQELLVAGVLEILGEGYAFLRTKGYLAEAIDVYVSPSQIRRAGLRTGDTVFGHYRMPKEQESFPALVRIDAVNFREPEWARSRPVFESLPAVYPSDKLMLDGPAANIPARLTDLVVPLGKGQRALAIGAPGSGKTQLLKDLVNTISVHHPEVAIFFVLIDERPEDVTEITRSVDGEVISTTFEETAASHVRAAEMVLEKAKRLVEMRGDVVVVIDSLTRLARAYHAAVIGSSPANSPPHGPQALLRPKRILSSARKIENGGSLTLLAALDSETGNRLDDLILEEFRGTANAKIVLDGKLARIGLKPALDLQASGTRREELLVHGDDLKKIWSVRRVLAGMPKEEGLETLLRHVEASQSNLEFINTIVGR